MELGASQPSDIRHPILLAHRSSESSSGDDEEWENVMSSSSHSSNKQYTAMLSNFSTSYNVVNISLVLPILKELIATSDDDDYIAAVASSLLAGMMVGQVFGGILGDTSLGHLRALVLVMIVQVVASLASSLVPLAQNHTTYVYLAVWRFVLGLGAGGVYPLAAALSAEKEEQHGTATDTDSPLHRVVLTFSMQGVGFWVVPFVGVILLYTVGSLDLVWRLLLGLGSIPGLVLLYGQWKLHKQSPQDREIVSQEEGTPLDVATSNSVVMEEAEETLDPSRSNADNGSHELADSDGEIGTSVLDSEAEEDEESMMMTSANENDGIMIDGESSVRHGWQAVKNEPHLWLKLMGTAATWFLFDVLFYGNTLFQPIVMEAAFGAKDTSESAIHLLRQTALESLILTSIALPGYAVAGFWIGKPCYRGCLEQTPRYVMMQGFAIMAVLYFVIGVGWKELKQAPVVLVVLYGLTFFFANYGPNTTTFVLPSLVFSPGCLSTLNGICAACGKLGAWTGASLFEPAADHFGHAVVMIVCSCISLLALGLTKAFVHVPSR